VLGQKVAESLVGVADARPLEQKKEGCFFFCVFALTERGALISKIVSALSQTFSLSLSFWRLFTVPKRRFFWGKDRGSTPPMIFALGGDGAKWATC
jgi:hypothetical protein